MYPTRSEQDVVIGMTLQDANTLEIFKNIRFIAIYNGKNTLEDDFEYDTIIVNVVNNKIVNIVSYATEYFSLFD